MQEEFQPVLVQIVGVFFFNAVVQFDPIDYEIGLYFLDGTCRDCGTLITLPTPLDKIREKE